jgi:hypothetical protein
MFAQALHIISERTMLFIRDKYKVNLNNSPFELMKKLTLK